MSNLNMYDIMYNRTIKLHKQHNESNIDPSLHLVDITSYTSFVKMYHFLYNKELTIQFDAWVWNFFNRMWVIDMFSDFFRLIKTPAKKS